MPGRASGVWPHCKVSVRRAVAIATALTLDTSGCLFDLGECDSSTKMCRTFDLLAWCDAQESCKRLVQIDSRGNGENDFFGNETWHTSGTGQVEIHGIQALAVAERLPTLVVVVQRCKDEATQCATVSVDGAPLSCSIDPLTPTRERCELPPTFDVLTVRVLEGNPSMQIFLIEPVCTGKSVCGG